MDFDKLQLKVDEIIKNTFYDFKGDIDFNRSTEIPVLILYVRYGDEIILVREDGNESSNWEPITGIVENNIPIKKLIFEQLEENLELDKEDIENIIIGEITEIYDSSDNIKYFEINILVDLNNIESIDTYDELEFDFFPVEELYNISIDKKFIKNYIKLIK